MRFSALRLCNMAIRRGKRWERRQPTTPATVSLPTRIRPRPKAITGRFALNKVGADRSIIDSEFRTAVVFWRFGDGGELTKSARGLAQSKTLPRNPQVHGLNACEKAKDGFA